MIEKIYKTIKEYGLIQKGDKVVIGLSGGADSMCLTHVLHQLSGKLGIELMTAHVNHGIRGEEAERDAEIAKEFSKNLGIEFVLKNENVPEYAKKNSLSEEMAGRKLRYEFFDELIRDKCFNKIATAHNRNDNAETIMMNFMRGSGLKGLCGIPYKRGNIIRPILGISRDEIEEYCHANGLLYVTDSTNKENIYTRNKIRLELIPMIEQCFNPNFINTITDNAVLLNDENKYIEDKSLEFYNNNVDDGKIDINALMSQPKAIQKRTIIEMVKRVNNDISDFSSIFADKIISLASTGKSGTMLNLPKKITASVEYGSLCVKKCIEIYDFEYNIEIGKEIYIPEIDKTVCAEQVNKKEGSGIFICATEKDKITIRNRRDGDFFYPTGMEGKKKLKNFFIDSKIPRDERRSMEIITINGDIACIGKKRFDRRYVFKNSGIKIKFV